MIFKSQYAIITLCVIASLLGGCTRQISPNVYAERHVGEASRSFRGIVVGVRDVQIEGKEKLEENAAGVVGGGVAGGVIGHQFGGGSGNALATVAGAAAGAIAGGFIQKELEKQPGIEYTVELTNGEMRTIVQGPEPRLAVGQRVLVIISHDGRSRVVADHTTFGRL